MSQKPRVLRRGPRGDSSLGQIGQHCLTGDRSMSRLLPMSVKVCSLGFVLGVAPSLMVTSYEPFPLESDCFFHLAVARDYADNLGYDSKISEGTLAAYHADKEPLFHLLLAFVVRPGTDSFAATRLICNFISGILGILIYWQSRSIVWTLLCVASSGTFMLRMSMCRPHICAVVFVVLGLQLLLLEKYWLVALLNSVYSLSYSVPILILAAAGVQALTTKKWKGLLLVSLGSVIGLLCHPQFPDNTNVLSYQILALFNRALAGGDRQIAVPDELLAPSITPFLADSVICILVLVCFTLQTRNLLWLKLFLCSLLGLALYSMRFIEYFAPCVFVVRPIWRSYSLPTWLSYCGAALLLLIGPVLGIRSAVNTLTTKPPSPPVYEGCALWLREHAPGDCVLNTEWYSYPELRYFGGNFSIVQGQDPSFISTYDQERYSIIQKAAKGLLDADIIATTLGVGYVVTKVGSEFSVAWWKKGYKALFASKGILLYQCK